MPTFTQLQYLVAVDKAKHFGRAARICNVSQPSLSAQIQKVEDALGFVVFDRSKQPIRTTLKGKRAVQQAKVILQEHGRIFKIQEDSQVVSGDFHLGVIPTLSSTLIPLFLQKFSEKYPQVRLKISETETEDIIQKLRDDELDGGLLVTPLNDKNIFETPLFYEPFFVFASEGHPYTKRNKVREKDLSLGDVWLLKEGHCFRDQVLRLCGASTKPSVLPNVDFESGSLETITNLIRLGRKGYTLLPELTTRGLTGKELKNQLKPFAAPIPIREVSFVQSREHLKEGIVRAIVAEILVSLPKSTMLEPPVKGEIIDI